MDGPVNSDCLAEVEQMYRTYFPSALFSYFYLDDYQDSLYKSDRNFGWIFASASLLAVFVACLGLWVVTFFFYSGTSERGWDTEGFGSR